MTLINRLNNPRKLAPPPKPNPGSDPGSDPTHAHPRNPTPTPTPTPESTTKSKSTTTTTTPPSAKSFCTPPATPSSATPSAPSTPSTPSSTKSFRTLPAPSTPPTPSTPSTTSSCPSPTSAPSTAPSPSPSPSPGAQKHSIIPICMSLCDPPKPQEALDIQRRHIIWMPLHMVGQYEAVWREDVPIHEEVIAAQVRAALQRYDATLALADLIIQPLANGSNNKVFSVQTSPSQSFVFRISMPLDPWYKTSSEVATMMYVREFTTIPVPRVYAFDPSSDNVLGLEWILMEMMPGSTYCDMFEDGVGRSHTAAKERVVRQLGQFKSELNAMTLPSAQIGQLYYHWSSSPSPTLTMADFYIGRIVSCTLFCADRLQYASVPRGPFQDFAAYFASILEVWRAEVEDKVNVAWAAKLEKMSLDPVDWTDDYSIPRRWYRKPTLTQVQTTCTELLQQFSHAQWSNVRPCEGVPTRLCHRDIHSDNFLVQPDGKITALLDWEMVHVLSVQFLGGLPKILESYVFDDEEGVKFSQIYEDELHDTIRDGLDDDIDHLDDDIVFQEFYESISLLPRNCSDARNYFAYMNPTRVKDNGSKTDSDFQEGQSPRGETESGED